jgi:hypothetical protein
MDRRKKSTNVASPVTPEIFMMTPSIALPSLYREALTSLASGKSPETVLDNLVKKGLLEEYARPLMAAALEEARKSGR